MGERQLRKIVIEGDPYSRGLQYGRQAKELIEKCLRFYKTVFTEVAKVDWKKALDFSKNFEKSQSFQGRRA
jgi:hypothetical protein